MKNGRKLSNYGREHCGKRRNCSLRAIFPFPMLFSKDLYCKHITQGLVWEGVKCKKRVLSSSVCTIRTMAALFG